MAKNTCLLDTMTSADNKSVEIEQQIIAVLEEVADLVQRRIEQAKQRLNQSERSNTNDHDNKNKHPREN